MELSFIGHEAVRIMVNSMLGYMPDGQPTWLLRTVRTICVQYVRALGVAYGGMPAAEKLGLCRLMLWEGMQRSLRACEGNEAMHFFCICHVFYGFICFLHIFESFYVFSIVF